MKAVNDELLELVKQVQALPSASEFALAGGTALAMRFNHRISDDIDLFTNKTIGKAGLENIASEFQSFFKGALIYCEIINAESGDQYCFLRALIATENKNIKVEVIQNIQLLTPFELHDGIRLLSFTDIGIMKLLSASSRKAKKDIYDLDFLTNEISVGQLLELLHQKEKKFNQEEHKCLFDLDNDPSPTSNISLLLEFDNIKYSSLPGRPSHSTDRIVILPGSKPWSAARSSWRRKVINLMKEKGDSLPGLKAIN